MKKKFKNGYALLIGIDKLKKLKLDHYDLKGSANAKALEEILTSKKACNYEKKNVITLTGKKATRENIIESLLDIGKKIRKGKSGNKSILIYFSGPEYWDFQSKGSPYYLIPYDIENDYNQLRNSAINAKLFEGLLEALPPENLCVIVDGSPLIPKKGSRDGDGPPPPVPIDPQKSGSKPFPDPPVDKPAKKGKTRNDDGPPPPVPIDPQKSGSKPFPDPPSGKGQWTLSANINGGISHRQKKGKLSIFTANLIEALERKVKKAKKSDPDVITVSELTNYLLNNVPIEAKAQGVKQKPTQKNNKIDFPIGLFRGGKGPKKKKAEEKLARVEVVEPKEEVPEKKKSNRS